MPDQCTTEVASAAAARTAAGCLLPSRLQRSSRIGATDVAEQENIVCALVRSHGRYFIGSGSKSEASGCRDWILRHLAHLGTDSPTAPSHSLCRAGWWPFSTAHPLDLLTIQFLPAREGAQPRVSRQVLCRPATCLPPATTRLFRPVFAPSG